VKQRQYDDEFEANLNFIEKEREGRKEVQGYQISRLVGLRGEDNRQKVRISFLDILN
jgi:hypothetical protein